MTICYPNSILTQFPAIEDIQQWDSQVFTVRDEMTRDDMTHDEMSATKRLVTK
jgi:hypothetical protein